MENFLINLENLTKEERKQLFSLVEKSKQPNSKKRWRANKQEIYFSLLGCGSIKEELEFGDYNNYNNNCYNIGNYFQTKEEAEFVREKLLVCQELKDYALEHNESELDWNNPNQNKYCLCLNYSDSKPRAEIAPLCINEVQRVKFPNTVYFTSSKIALDAINAVGEERIIKYLF